MRLNPISRYRVYILRDTLSAIVTSFRRNCHALFYVHASRKILPNVMFADRTHMFPGRWWRYNVMDYIHRTFRFSEQINSPRASPCVWYARVYVYDAHACTEYACIHGLSLFVGRPLNRIKPFRLALTRVLFGLEMKRATSNRNSLTYIARIYHTLATAY